MNGINDVLQQMESWLGGADAIDALHALHAIADVDAPDGRFRNEIYSAVDGRMRFLQLVPNQPPFIAGIGRKDSWQQSAPDSPLSDVAVSFLRGHELHMLILRPHSRLQPPHTLSQAHFAGQNAHLLTFRDGLAAPFELFVAQGSGQPLGMRLRSHRDPDSPPVVITFAAWQPMGPLRLFGQATFQQGQEQFVYHYQTVALNTCVDQLFEPDLDDDLGELLRLHEAHRHAHLTRDSDLLVSSFADTLITIDAGQIYHSTSAESRARFATYFGNVEFVEWENRQPPQITLSDDRSLATVAVSKRVRVRPPGQPDAPIGETNFAWLEQWQQGADGWKLTMICSTRA